ncbi:MAG: hypothetical protein HC875_24280 [Anaerolineales bacterium]|nr:hypothetical protein [Anaerolineales bacterium]
MTIQSPEFFTYAEIKQAADFIQSRTNHQPTLSLVLGSGLGPLADEIEAASILPS